MLRSKKKPVAVSYSEQHFETLSRKSSGMDDLKFKHILQMFILSSGNITRMARVIISYVQEFEK